MHKENINLEEKTSVKYYEIKNKKYKVVRHYIGNKDLYSVIYKMAIQQAYADMKIPV